MMYPFMKDKRYVEIVKEYVDAYKHAAKQRKYQVIDEKVKADSKEAATRIKSNLESFRSSRLNEIKQEKRKIEKIYKSKRNRYANPQEELLKRQDFETEIMATSDEELSKLIVDENRTYTEFEINRLQVEFKKRDMGNEQVRLKAIKKSKHIGHEYLNDPNYKALMLDEEYLHLIDSFGRNDALLYIPNEGSRPKSISLKGLSTAGNVRKRELTLSERNALSELEIIENGYKVLDKNIQSHQEWLSQFDKQREDDKKQYIKNKKARNEVIQVYDDNDLRANRDSEQHDIEIEFQYLKERYNDPDNWLYSPGNPDYNVAKHINYLRGQHLNTLKNDPDLANRINQALSEELENGTDQLNE